MPGFVTLPTPSPPSISIEFGFVVSSKSTTISAPCVTSGSSPPSLITEQRALFLSNLQLLILIFILSFFGSKTSTDSIFF
jgi:hypothetical protein